jgi:hypothetical protein
MLKTNLMFQSRIPSLRNFAVITRVSRTAYGTFYAVQDRRVIGQQQLLFLPNKTRAWPRYLFPFGALKGAPVRLRSGKVGFILPAGVDCREVLQTLNSREVYSFNALTGFQPEKKSRKASLYVTSAIIFISIICGAVAVAPDGNQTIKVAEVPMSNVEVSCADQDLVGMLIPKRAHKVFTIQDCKFELLNRVSLGGFINETVMRLSDSKILHISAWLREKNYEVYEVN